MNQPTLTGKDAALRAVGRTVVNFQRLENNLKLAARLGPVEGTPSKVQRDIARRIERASSLTLGQAIQTWLAAIGTESPASSQTPDLFDITMRMTFSLGIEAESNEAHASALKELLEIRNNLIHGGLVHFRWDSAEECDRLVKTLDELNDKIRSQIEFLHSILSAVGEIREEDIQIEQEVHQGHLALVARTKGEPQ